MYGEAVWIYLTGEVAIEMIYYIKIKLYINFFNFNARNLEGLVSSVEGIKDH
jgi:hypothetical protein